jgi:hypothetical protein
MVGHVTPCCECKLLLYECFFDLMFRSVCNGWQDRAMCLHQVLHVAQYIHYQNSWNVCEAFRGHSLSWTVVFEWRSCFNASRVSAEDDKCSGWPSTSRTMENVEKVRELIYKDCRRTIHKFADITGISYRICKILTENVNMRHIAAKFFPPLLTNDEKQRRVNVCIEL